MSTGMTKGQIKLLRAFAGSRKKNGMTRAEAVAEAKIKAQGSGPMIKGLVNQGFIEAKDIVPDGDSSTGSTSYYKATQEGRKALKKATKK